MIDITYIENFISQVDQEIEMAYDSQDYEKAICCSKFLCSFYYQYDYKYHDEKIEILARKSARCCIGECNIKKPNKNKVLFYDKFGLNNRGIANIYIKALIKLGYEVIWCLHDRGSEVHQIIERFAGEENIRFELIPNLSVIERMHYLKKVILAVNAYHYFIYTTPSDVECLGVFAIMTGSIQRYLINLTDHTFWLGTCALDYCIEFRNLGANISTKFRKIKKEKIAILPYYPEKREYEKFQGFPFAEKEEFVFSGGSAYKIESSNKFEQMVSEILDKYLDLKFVYATNDKSEKLEMLSSKYKGRFFIVNERQDLDAIFQRAKFYLSTYPIPGALMSLYALSNNCIPLCLADKNNDIANTASWLINSDQVDFVFYEISELLKKVDQLMHQDDAGKVKFTYQQFIISEEEFKIGLGKILNGEKTKYCYHEENVNTYVFHSYYKKKLTEANFRRTIQQSNNKWLAAKYPELFIESRKK